MKKTVIILLHIGYWIMYAFVMLFIIMSIHGGEKNLSGTIVWHTMFFSPFTMFAIFPGIIGLYTFYGVLFKRYLTKKKLLKFFIAVLAVLALGAALTEILLYLIFGH